MALLSELLGLPDGWRPQVLDQGSHRITLVLTPRTKTAYCPICLSRSRRVHCYRQRSLQHLPCAGKTLDLIFLVRHWYCCNKRCPRKTFTDSLAPFAASGQRTSRRLSSVQTQLGLLSGGEAGARTARINGIRTSGDTLLRRVVQAPEPQSEEVQHIGIDDWAWRKGRRYGTLLVNLDTRRPITLLPGRGQRSLAVWLKKHPEIRVVSRNRASAYAQAATQGAPQAVQVADRWHLLKNIGDALERVVYRYAAALRLVAKALAPSKPTVTTDSENESGDVRQPERLKQQRRQTRHTRWENVMKLHQLGHSQRSIARQTGLHRVTIRRWIQSGDYPEMASRPILPGLLTPWRHWLETRWREGHHNARHLWQEMTAEGFTG